MKSLMIAAAALVLSASAYGVSQAQDAGSAPPPGGGVRAACAADVAKLCPGMEGPDRRQCMMSKQDQVSDGCKAAIQAAMAARQSAGGSAGAPAPK